MPALHININAYLRGIKNTTVMYFWRGYITKSIYMYLPFNFRTIDAWKCYSLGLWEYVVVVNSSSDRTMGHDWYTLFFIRAAASKAPCCPWVTVWHFLSITVTDQPHKWALSCRTQHFHVKDLLKPKSYRSIRPLTETETLFKVLLGCQLNV